MTFNVARLLVKLKKLSDDVSSHSDTIYSYKCSKQMLTYTAICTVMHGEKSPSSLSSRYHELTDSATV